VNLSKIREDAKAYCWRLVYKELPDCPLKGDLTRAFNWDRNSSTLQPEHEILKIRVLAFCAEQEAGQVAASAGVR
jgi:hypothetical protein